MSREAMQQALDAFDYFFPTEDGQLWHTANDVKKIDDARQALQQALETEPFEYWNAVEGWVKIDEMREHFDSVGCGTIYKSAGEGRSPLYAAPQKQWVGMTDEEIAEIAATPAAIPGSYVHSFACAIEAKLKEKNHG